MKNIATQICIEKHISNIIHNGNDATFGIPRLEQPPVNIVSEVPRMVQLCVNIVSKVPRRCTYALTLFPKCH